MASSGKITAHNLHLLIDDGEGEGQNMPDDDLNLRTATADSRTSADSRKMDESPVEDDPGEPPANLDEEARYQEDLKERVKRSFADLGIEPEGVLLKGSLVELPRDSLEIDDDLPYDSNITQGEYDARRKKQIENDANEVEVEEEDSLDQIQPGETDENDASGDQNNVDDEIDESHRDEEEIGIDDNQESVHDNILADSLEAGDQLNDPHPEETNSVYTESKPQSVQEAEESNLGDDGDADPSSGLADQNFEDSDAVESSEPLGLAEQDDDVNLFRDSLEDNLEPELNSSKLSNEPELEENAAEELGDVDQEEDSLDNISEPNSPNDNLDNDTPQGNTEEYPLVPEPLELTDKAQEAPFHLGGEIDEDSGGTYDDAAPDESVDAPNANENHKQFDDDDMRGNESNIEDHQQSRNDFSPENIEPIDTGRKTYQVPSPENKFPVRSDSAQFQTTQPESRGNSRGTAPSPLANNVNNNANGSNGKPPSGGSARSQRSNSSRQQYPSEHHASPPSQTPVRSRPNSRERERSYQSLRKHSKERETPASRSRSRERNGYSRLRSGSASRVDSRQQQGSRSSERRGSTDRSEKRRGSNDIVIPKFARKGVNGIDGEEALSKERTIGSENGHRSRTDDLPSSAPSHIRDSASKAGISPTALKPPSGNVQQNPSLSNGQGQVKSLTSLKTSSEPRNFMTPGQQLEAEANKKFWSEMQDAGVFNPSTSQSPKKEVSAVEKLRSGEKVVVEYISDDSGDEDLHFVDEKGSPIDQLGRPLYAATPSTPDIADLRIMYRIKPSPPKQKLTRKSSSGRQRSDVSAANSSRYNSGGRQQSRDVSAADSSRYNSSKYSRNSSGNKSGRGSSRLPVRQVVDRQVSPIEDEILQEDSPQDGNLESTIPPPPAQATPVKERMVKSACLQTGIDDDPPPSEEVQNSETLTLPVQEVSIQTSDEHVTGGQENTYPPHDPNESPQQTPSNAPVGHVSVAQLHQQSPSHPNQFQFPADAYAQHVPMAHSGNPQAHWQPSAAPGGYPQQPFAAPLQPQFVNPVVNQGINQEQPYQMNQPYHVYAQPQGSPFHQPPVQPYPYQQQIHPQMIQGGMPYQTQPHVGMPYQYQGGSPGSYANQSRPFQGQDPAQSFADESEPYQQAEEGRRRSQEKRLPPKPRQNFIDINKTSAKLRRDPPNKKYTEALGQKKGYKSPMNPRKPLPQISRENSQDEGQSSTGWTPHGSATSRSNDLWAQQVLHEQQMVLLARGMSDPNIYPPPQMPVAPARHGSVPGNYAGGAPSSGGFPTPDTTNPQAVNGQPYSWSADRANAYARMNAMNQANQGPMGGQHYHDPNDGFNNNMTSPRQRMAYTHPQPKRSSPFQVLPNIPVRKSDENPELRTSDPEGYFMKHQKQKQGPQYKPYTLKEFQNLKKDFSLGGLGPDKETINARQEKIARQKDYARQVMEQNKKVFRQSPTIGMQPEKGSPKTELSKRDMALEYAKKVPKPRVPTPPEVLHDRLYGSGSNSRQSGGSRSSTTQEEAAAAHRENIELEMARLDELTKRHQHEKDELDKLKKGIPT